MTKYPLGVAYDEYGKEDLDKTYRNAVLNVRYFVEREGLDWQDAVYRVVDHMHLIYIEEDKLYEEAELHYNVK